MRRFVSCLAAAAMLSLSGCYYSHMASEELRLSDFSSEEAPQTEGLSQTEETIESPATEENAGDLLAAEEQEYCEVSQKNQQWVDFAYLEDYSGITDPSLCTEQLEKAAALLKATEDYAALTENYQSSFIDVSPYLDENGVLQPLFHSAYIEDFDSNGTAECFILLDLPKQMTNSIEPCVYLFYIGDGGAEMIDTYFLGMNGDLGISEISLLDYGLCKQLIICNNHTFGVSSHSEIYGVVNGAPVTHYRFRGSFSKWRCFLTAAGWQGSGGTMYYDTALQEYRMIAGETLSHEEVYALDSTGALPDIKYPVVTLLGGKYYIVTDAYSYFDLGEIFTYENGEFIPVPEECRLRIASVEYRDVMVKIDDLDEVFSSMISPEAGGEIYDVERGHITLTEVSPEHCWVEFAYIDPEGVTDVALCDGAAAAVDALMQTEDYTTVNAALKSGEYLVAFLSEEFYSLENGEYLPVFECAYIDDFDCDGYSRENEQFILLKYPYCSHTDGDGKAVLWDRHYLAFVDSDGRAEIIDSFYQYDVRLLNYGMDKQLLFCGAGYCGVDSHSPIWGVVDGSPKELYSIRGGYERHGCFLTADGVQGLGDFMYYDTAAREYRAIVGDLLSKDAVYAMDSTGSAPYDYDTCYEVSLVGGKYYLFSAGAMDDGKVCTYENGRFVAADGTGIRTASGLRTAVKLPDIDRVYSEMTEPVTLDLAVAGEACLAALDIDKKTAATISVRYYTTCEINGRQWYNGTPWLTITDRVSGERLDYREIDIGTASTNSDSKCSPPTAQLAAFEVGEDTVLAAAMPHPLGEVLRFYCCRQREDGTRFLTTIDSLSGAPYYYDEGTLDLSAFTADGNTITDNLGCEYTVEWF